MMWTSQVGNFSSQVLFQQPKNGTNLRGWNEWQACIFFRACMYVVLEIFVLEDPGTGMHKGMQFYDGPGEI